MGPSNSIFLPVNNTWYTSDKFHVYKQSMSNMQRVARYRMHECLRMFGRMSSRNVHKLPSVPNMMKRKFNVANTVWINLTSYISKDKNGQKNSSSDSEENTSLNLLSIKQNCINISVYDINKDENTEYKYPFKTNENMNC